MRALVISAIVGACDTKLSEKIFSPPPLLVCIPAI
jgi:hypothetical protein